MQVMPANPICDFTQWPNIHQQNIYLKKEKENQKHWQSTYANKYRIAKQNFKQNK